VFGYVRARQDTMPPGLYADYEAVYCGLCRTLGRRRGWFARLFLNYDFAFLAMLLAPGQASPAPERRACPRHPVAGMPCCAGDEWLDEIADKSVILSWWKLRDSVGDESFFQALCARLLCLGLGGAYRGARRASPAFDHAVSDCLGRLDTLESQRCENLDAAADCFAGLLASASEAAGRPGGRAERQLLYHLGRWIYLIDAVDDLESDRRAGRYNPVLARFPLWTQEDRAYLRQLLEASRGLMGAAFQLLTPNAWTPVLENIIYSGLPGVEELVFSGRWRAYLKYRREAYE